MQIPEQLIDKYIDRRFDELTKIKIALDHLDFVLIQKVGHQLKGNGAMFGFPSISDFGKELETLSASQDPGPIQDWILRYHQYIESVRSSMNHTSH